MILITSFLHLSLPLCHQEPKRASHSEAVAEEDNVAHKVETEEVEPMEDRCYRNDH
jgi:hypothetical protein